MNEDGTIRVRPKKEKKKFTFVYESGIIEYCTKMELIQKYPTHNLKIDGLCRNIIGKTTNHKGWRVIKEDEQLIGKPLIIPKNTIVHTFVHDSGLSESCSILELIQKYPDQNLRQSGLFGIIYYNQSHHKGWRMEKPVD